MLRFSSATQRCPVCGPELVWLLLVFSLQQLHTPLAFMTCCLVRFPHAILLSKSLICCSPVRTLLSDCRISSPHPSVVFQKRLALGLHFANHPTKFPVSCPKNLIHCPNLQVISAKLIHGAQACQLSCLEFFEPAPNLIEIARISESCVRPHCLRGRGK